LAVSLSTMYPFDKVERAVRNTPGVIRAEGWIATEGAIPLAGDPPADNNRNTGGSHSIGSVGGGHGGGATGEDRFSVLARPADTNMLALDIREGRGLLPGETDARGVNTALAAKAPQIKVGNTVNLRLGPEQTSWRVVGIAREPFSPAVA